MSVYANGRSIVHKGDNKTQTCPIPDVCKTPSPAGPVPIPYVNVAMDSDLDKGTKKVKIEDNSVALKSSNLKTSSGDEPGTAGGVVSSKNKGKLTWAVASNDVKFEGKGVVRFLDTCLHNGNTNNTGGQPNIGAQMMYGGTCPICGKTHGVHTDEESDQAAEELQQELDGPDHGLSNTKKKGLDKGKMMGAMVCKDAQGNKVTLKAYSGSVGKSTIDGYCPPVENPKPPSAYGLPNEEKANPPGSCAAPKLIQEAKKRGLEPVAMTEFWYGKSRTESNPKREKGHKYESCSTCQKVVPAMLCPDAPPEDEGGGGG
jgi:hypothetical protein